MEERSELESQKPFLQAFKSFGDLRSFAGLDFLLGRRDGPRTTVGLFPEHGRTGLEGYKPFFPELQTLWRETVGHEGSIGKGGIFPNIILKDRYLSRGALGFW